MSVAISTDNHLHLIIINSNISHKKYNYRFWGHIVIGAIITSKYRCIECVCTFRQTNHCKGKFIFITRISLQLGNIDLNNRQLQTYICIQVWQCIRGQNVMVCYLFPIIITPAHNVVFGKLATYHKNMWWTN